MMVLGTLVAFVFVAVGAFRLKLVPPLVSILGGVGCAILALNLSPLVLQVYLVTCPLGLLIYFLYGRKHSKLARQESGNGEAQVVTS
jgi:APA family basic amino acid/polyamine antiporter